MNKFNAIIFVLSALVLLSKPAAADEHTHHHAGGHPEKSAHQLSTSQRGVDQASAVKNISGKGTINVVMTTKNMINISHQPIAELGWPKMKMNFNVAKSVNLEKFKPGQRVEFILQLDSQQNTTVTALKVID